MVRTAANLAHLPNRGACRVKPHGVIRSPEGPTCADYLPRMPLLVTDAVVLHAMDYLESSRILRLATREGGVRSALARGARRSARRFGSGLDLFAQGTVQLHTKPGRDLDTLAGMEIARSRPTLGTNLDRFTGAGAIAELTLRFAGEDTDPALYDSIVAGLDAIAAAPPERARDATLGAAWHLIATMGFAPNVNICSECHDEIDPATSVRFVNVAGGAVCARCARLAPTGRTLPPEARAALTDWLEGRAHAIDDDASAHAHQRLLREFLHEHLADNRPLKAFDVWAGETWSAA